MSEDLHKQNREVLFENEKFLLGLLQAVSAAIIAGAISQFDKLSQISGITATKILLSLSAMSLALAIVSAFSKHEYKKWDLKAACKTGNEQNKRYKKAGRYLRLMRWGMLLSTISLCLGLFIFIGSLWNCCDYLPITNTTNLSSFLEKWQTLLAGLLALGAAIWGAILLKSQIAISENHENTRRKTAEAAARAVLPLTLSSIIDYTEQSSNTLHTLYQSREGEVIPERARTIDIPQVPESAIGSLQSMIESSTNPEIVKVISKLIQKIQIQNSRMRSAAHREQSIRPNRINLVLARYVEDYIIDSAKIHAFASSLFSYARFSSETPEEVSWDNVSQSLMLLNWAEHIHTDLYKTLAIHRAESTLVE